ncbi:hypothetical protein [Mycolicibacterium sp. A43C]
MTSAPVHRYEWRTILASAGSALLGALLGAASSFLIAAQSNSYELTAAQLSKRQTDYAAYLAAETEVQDAAATLVTYLQSYETTDPQQIAKANEDFTTTAMKANEADYIVALSCSQSIDEIRVRIAKVRTGIRVNSNAVASSFRSGLDPDDAGIRRMAEQVTHLRDLFDEFIRVARDTDLRPR